MFKDLDLMYENGKVEILEKFGGDVFLILICKSLSVIFMVENDVVVVFFILKGRGLSFILRVVRL